MRCIAALVTAAALLAAGCGRPPPGAKAKELRTVSHTPPRPVDRADGVHLLVAPPTALNWDDVPGPDGVQVQVFLTQAGRSEPVLIKGTLECLLFEGRVQREQVTGARPLVTWAFPAADLVDRQVRAIAGWGYVLQLGWGRQVPASPVVTVTARYQPPDGPLVYSAPVAIPLSGLAPAGPTRRLDTPSPRAGLELRDRVTFPPLGPPHDGVSEPTR